MRILVVEDDEQLQRILTTLLTKDPVLQRRAPELVVVGDGIAALEQIRARPFSLVISDLLMPRMNGFEFCAKLRLEPNGANVPLIVTSAVYRDAKMLQNLERETRCRFFAKPFQIAELLDAIRSSLDPVKPAPVAPAPRTEELAQRGSLVTHPPARLLLDAWERRASGTLQLVRGKMQKDVALVNGTPVSVTSNMRSETLGHFLLAQRKITDAQHQQALAHASTKNERLGAALVELGFLTQAVLLAELAAQHEQKLINVLRWPDGEFRFTPGSPTARPPGPVDLPQLLFSGLRRTARPDEIQRALEGNPAELELDPRFAKVADRFTAVFGEAELPQLQRRPRIDLAIEHTRTSEAKSSLLIQLDALLVCGLASVIPVDGESADAAPLPDGTPAAPRRTADSGLFGELFGEVEAPPVQPAAEAPSPPRAAPPQSDPRRAALEAEVLDLYVRLLGKSHHDVLAVSRDSTRVQIEAAYRRRIAQTTSERFAALEAGEPRDKLRQIQIWARDAFEVLSDDGLRATYEQALQRKGTVSPSVDAEIKAQKAIEQLGAGLSQPACLLLEEAVRLAPDQPDYHALLGWALFLTTREATNPAMRAATLAHARAAIDQAVALDPDHVPAHQYAAAIAAEQGNTELALEHYEQILAKDPWNAEALAQYDATANDPRRTERQLRKLIHRVTGTATPEQTIGLWLRLGELYRGRLDDRESSLTSFSVAARLAPLDPRPHAALARIYREDGGDQPKAVEALRSWWRLAPDDEEPGRALFALLGKHEAWDAALTTGAALVQRGLADDATTQFVQRYRPRFLIRLQQPLAHPIFDAIRHPDDLPGLQRLFALVEQHVPSPFRIGDLGLAADAVPLGTKQPLADHAATLFRYVAAQLGVALPRLYPRADLGPSIHVGATDELVLLVGEQALAQPRLALAFRIARALSFCLPGRSRPSALPTRQLRWLFLAAATLVEPRIPVDDPDREVARLRERLVPHAATLHPALQPLVAQLLSLPRDQLNLASFARAITRTADRVGYLICGDLTTAAEIVASEGAEGAVDDLLDFAQSEAALAARREIGVSVDV